MDYQIQPFDTIHFCDGIFYVNCRRFVVVSIDGETKHEPIVGVDGKRVLTEFRGGLVNQWDQDLIVGYFLSE
jgi:hypothetical protein